MKCDRCHKETRVTIMSWFNTQTICMDCSEKEHAHPKLGAARDAEAKACRAGNFNFTGVGLPSDLRR